MCAQGFRPGFCANMVNSHGTQRSRNKVCAWVWLYCPDAFLARCWFLKASNPRNNPSNALLSSSLALGHYQESPTHLKSVFCVEIAKALGRSPAHTPKTPFRRGFAKQPGPLATPTPRKCTTPLTRPWAPQPPAPPPGHPPWAPRPQPRAGQPPGARPRTRSTESSGGC